MQNIPAENLIDAARRVSAKHPGDGLRRTVNFGPIVDGRTLMRDPFLPSAPEQSKDIPIMIGWNKDEMKLFTASQPWFATLDDAALSKMMEGMGPASVALAKRYQAENPDYAPTHIANRVMGARFVVGSYTLADAKARQEGAPVYMYRLTYETQVNDGALRSPHTLDIPFMFNNAEESRVQVGPGEDPLKLEAMMSDAWISFARTGTPESELLPSWPAYNPDTRLVMEFDVPPRVALNPEQGAREILSATRR